MQCESCHAKKASVHFRQVLDGNSIEMFLCEECAAKKGFNVEAPLGLTDFLFGLGPQKKSEKIVPVDDRACPACHMRRSDFRKTSRLGCPACYETFGEELAPILEEMHRGFMHVGKTPAWATCETRLAALKKALDEAVASQHFEDAARIRDMIHNLESLSQKAGKV